VGKYWLSDATVQHNARGRRFLFNQMSYIDAGRCRVVWRRRRSRFVASATHSQVARQPRRATYPPLVLLDGLSTHFAMINATSCTRRNNGL